MSLPRAALPNRRVELEAADRRCLAAIAEESSVLNAAIACDPTATVSRYPTWKLRDLGAHVGSVHRWAAAIVAARSTEPVHRSDAPIMPDDQLGAWLSEGVDALLRALKGSAPTARVWSYTNDKSVRFWLRRMAHETTLHRWDAQAAIGTPSAIPTPVAVTGLAEAIHLHVVEQLDVARLAVLQGMTVSLTATNAQIRASLAFASHGVIVPSQHVDDADIRLAGTAEDLWLCVTGRLDLSALEVDGDDALLVALSDAIRAILPARR